MVQEAPLQAIASRCPKAGFLHHSDRGVQYASHDYRQLLLSLEALPSMNPTGYCYDNAAMESFWSTLKTESLSELSRFNDSAIQRFNGHSYDLSMAQPTPSCYTNPAEASASI